MSLQEHIKKWASAISAFVDAMEAGASGDGDDRIGSLEKRVTELERSRRETTQTISAERPA